MFNQRLLIVGMSCCLLFLTTGSWSLARPEPFHLALSNRRPAALKLLVVSISTEKPIANRSVTINSDNGVRCVMAPCPTNSKQWQGRTNRQGLVVIPQKVIQQSTTIKIPGYMAKDLGEALPSQPGISKIELAEVVRRGLR